jgi:hypothetical protein
MVSELCKRAHLAELGRPGDAEGGSHYAFRVLAQKLLHLPDYFPA